MIRRTETSATASTTRLPGVLRLVALAVIVLSLGFADPALAQRNPLRQVRVDEGLLKSSPALLDVVTDVAREAAGSTVRFFVDNEPASLGVVVRSDGFVLTKASELDESLQAELPDGRRVGGRIIGVAQEHDLALVKVEAQGLDPVEFDSAAMREATAGMWLVTPGVGSENVLAVGNVSVGELRQIPSSGSLLGIGLGETAAGIPVHEVTPGGAAAQAGLRAGDLILKVDGVPVGTMRGFVRMLRNGPSNGIYTITFSRAGKALETEVRLEGGQLGVTLVTEAAGVPVSQVSPGSGAEAAGIRPGDLILAIDDTPVRDPRALVQLIRGRSPGDVIDVTLLREGDEETLEATLGYRSTRSLRGDYQNNLGTRLSGRAVDFPAVLQHDTVLNAEQMGGPLLDVEGNVIGMNIARAGRVETYALPAQVIQQVLPELLSGKLPAATAPAQDETGKPMSQPDLLEE